jgi:hypothetical protein
LLATTGGGSNTDGSQQLESKGGSAAKQTQAQHTRSASTAPLFHSSDAQSLLAKLRSTMAEGFATRALQRSPHLVLPLESFHAAAC